MERAKIYFLETRPQFLFLSVILVLLGGSVSLILRGKIIPFDFILALTGLVLLHISVNVLNDYFDYRSGIDFHTRRTPFNGGSGILTSGLMKPEEAFWFGIVAFILAVPEGLYFLHKIGLKFLPIILSGAIFVLLYTPVLARIGYGVAEMSAGLGLGLLPVYGVYVVMTGDFSLHALLYSVPSGLLVASLLLINEIPDVESDILGGRKTIPIQIGKRKAFYLYLFLTGLSYVWIIVMVLAGVFSPYMLLSLVTLPLYLKILRNGGNLVDSPEFVKIQGLNVPIVLLTQFFMALGLFINYFVR